MGSVLRERVEKDSGRIFYFDVERAKIADARARGGASGPRHRLQELEQDARREGQDHPHHGGRFPEREVASTFEGEPNIHCLGNHHSHNHSGAGW